MSHSRLDALPAVKCHEELADSKRLLEDQLGQEVRHLAYPHGCFTEQVKMAAAEAGYRSACSVRIGLSPWDDDRMALHRVPVNGQDSLPDFICRLRTAKSVREFMGDGLRALVGRVR